MCCRLKVSPLDVQLAEMILLLGKFTPALIPGAWIRSISSEDGARTISIVATVTDPEMFSISISPSISTYKHHEGNRESGGIMFEIAAKYAEKCDGEISQLANVGDCVIERGGASPVIARYPNEPLMWSKVCVGFRELLLKS